MRSTPAQQGSWYLPYITSYNACYTLVFRYPPVRLSLTSEFVVTGLDSDVQNGCERRASASLDAAMAESLSPCRQPFICVPHSREHREDVWTHMARRQQPSYHGQVLCRRRRRVSFRSRVHRPWLL